MTYQEIQDKIVSTFWSEGLKKHIRETGYVFPPEDLLAVIYQHIHDFEERMEYLQLMADHVPEAAEHARQILAWERRRLEDFRRPGPGEVYELRVSDEPGGEETNFLCGDFDTAVALIDRYYEWFDWLEETERSRYSILRRRLLTASERSYDDVLGSCDLLPGKRINRVWYGGKSELPDCTENCAKCHQQCVANQEAEYPNFLPENSPVRYRLPDGSVHLGVTLEQRPMECLAYVIPLDGELLSNRNHDEDWGCHWHEHLPLPYVDTVSREELPDDLRENLDAFLTFWERKFGK